MNDRTYLLDIAGLILCIIMISVVAILINIGTKDSNVNSESQSSAHIELNQPVSSY